MTTRALFLLPVIAIIVLTSGCTFFPNVTTGASDVIIIQSMSAIPSTIMAGQSTKITAVIKNQGSEHVPQSGMDADTNVITVHLYDYCQGLFSLSDNDMVCNGEKVQSNGSSKFDICKLNTLSINEMKQVEWGLKQTPNAQVKSTCDVKVSITYPYETIGLTPIYLINSKELQNQIADGTYAGKTPDVTKGDGPVKAWFEVVGTQPVSVDPGSSTENSITLELHIENTGTGNVENNKVWISDIKLAASDGSTNDQIIIKNEGATAICKSLGELNNQPKKDKRKDMIEVVLVQGEKTIICPATISDSLANFPKETTTHAEVTIQYTYEDTKETKVTVEPLVA